MIINLQKSAAVVSTLLASPLYLFSSGLLAQDARNEGEGRVLDEIVVTAQKRAERIQDVPIAVSVVSSEALTATGVSNLRNLGEVVPGLVSNDLSGYQHFFIRGIGSDYSQTGVNQSVATYLDGVVLQSSIGANQNLTDVQRVEVLKGPQGTLYGRNATGGAINVVTRDPTDQFALEVAVGGGNHGKQVARGFIAGPIGGNFAASLAGMYDTHDPYLDNIGGPQFRDPFVKGTRGKIVYTAPSGAEAKLSGFWFKSSFGGDSNFAQLQPNSTGAGLGGRNAGADGAGEFFVVSNDFYMDSRYEQRGGNLTLRAPLTGFDIVSISGYTRYHQFAGADFDATDAPIAWFRSPKTIDRTFTQEVQLVSTADSGPQWLAGVYYFHNLAGYPEDGPLLTPDGLGGVNQLRATATTDSYAVFGQTKLALADAWSLTLGARYGRDEIAYKGFSVNGGPREQASSPSWSNFSPKVTLDWKRDDVMIYGTLTSGYKAGSFNVTSSAAPGPVEPEKVYGAEIGMKADLGSAARVEASAFGYRYKDLQISYIPNNTNPTILTNADEAEIIGLELSGVFAPLDNLQITPGISWLARAKYKDYENGTDYIDNAIAQPAFPFGYTVQTADFTGNRMQRTPKLSGNVGVDYTWTLPFGSLKAAGNVYYTDSYYFTAQNVDFARQDSYTQLNASLTYTSPDERWSVTAAGQNLGDEETYSDILPNVIGIVAQYAPPRTYYFTVGYKY